MNCPDLHRSSIIFVSPIKSVFMSQTISDKLRFTTADLELLPENGDRYEIIDGELFMTRAPHWGHQQACGRFFSCLDGCSVARIFA
jgi:hypothetical protein